MPGRRAAGPLFRRLRLLRCAAPRAHAHQAEHGRPNLAPRARAPCHRARATPSPSWRPRRAGARARTRAALRQWVRSNRRARSARLHDASSARSAPLRWRDVLRFGTALAYAQSHEIMSRTEIEAFVRRWLALMCAGDSREFAQISSERPRDVQTGQVVSRATFRARAVVARRALADLEGRVEDFGQRRRTHRLALHGVLEGSLFGQAPRASTSSSAASIFSASPEATSLRITRCSTRSGSSSSARGAERRRCAQPAPATYSLSSSFSS